MLDATYEHVIVDDEALRRWRFRVGFQESVDDGRRFSFGAGSRRAGAYFPEEALLEMARRAEGSRNVRTEDRFVVFETPDIPLRVLPPSDAEEARDG